MSKSSRTSLIIIAIIVIAVILLLAVVTSFYHWDFLRPRVGVPETTVCQIDGLFDGITIDTETADIVLSPAEDDKCTVVFTERKNMKHTAEVTDGTLKVTLKDARKWYEFINISFISPKVTVYLPEAVYESAVIGTSTGNVMISGFQTGSLDISVTTGDVLASDTDCTGDLRVAVSTGDVYLTDVVMRNLVSSGTTGDVVLKNVIAKEKVSIDRTTGDVTLNASDAGDILVKTTTGDVNGSLLTEKVFTTKTSTGSVSVPSTESGGKCEIITSTGDIKFR